MDGVCSVEKSVKKPFVADGTHEVTCSNTEQECQSNN
jgi:CDGSH-type Zn-finger protein